MTTRQTFLLIMTPLAMWNILFTPLPFDEDLNYPPKTTSTALRFGSGQIRGAAMMLVSKPWTTQRGGRQCYFNKSLDDLTNNWYPTNPYPLVLQHPNGWSQQEMDDIRQRWPQLEIYFSKLGSSFHVSPPSLMEDHEKPLSSLGYKKMCVFKTYGFLQAPYVSQLDYMFYIDDDACITEPIQYDVFQIMQQNDIAYAYKQIFLDPVNVVRGLADFVEDYKQGHQLQPANPSLEAVMGGNDEGSLWAFSTNVEWMKLNAFRRSDVRDFHATLHELEIIFHRRWGDAPLRFVLAYLFFTNTQVMRMCLEYVHSSWPTAVSTCSDNLQLPIIQNAVLDHLQNCVAVCN